MNSNEDFEKIIDLLKCVGVIKGRTKFQKMVYILQNQGVSFSEKFKYHYYGPYSSELQLEIDELVDRGIFKEKEEGPSSIYELNSEVSDSKITDREIKQNGNLIKFLVEQDYQELELVATIYYLQNIGYTNWNMIRGKLNILKPHLSSKFEKSYKLFMEINNN
jgi:uncharacterized protein YwgA